MRIQPSDGDLSTLLADVAAGTEVELEAGDYRLAVPLLLKAPLTLKGAGMFQTRLVGTVTLAQGGHLENLSLERAGTEPGPVAVNQTGALTAIACRFRGAISHDGELQAGLLLQGDTEATLSECHFEHNQGHGLRVVDRARCQAERCHFKSNRNLGAVLDGESSGRLSECEAAENGSGLGLAGQAAYVLHKNFCHDHGSGMGITCSSTGAVEIQRNECLANISGIELRDQTRALVERNECSDNGVNGISCFDDCTPVVKNNSCRANGQAGIQAWEQARPRIERNFCFGNGEVGISFHESSGGAALGNQCLKSRLGMAVNDLAAPDLTGNECTANGGGLVYYDQAGGTATANRVSENLGIGIQVGDNSAPLLIENQSSQNQAFGIAFMQSARGLARGNQCWKNAQSDRVVVMDSANPQLAGNLTHKAGTGLLERVKGLFGAKRAATEDPPAGPEPDDVEIKELTDMPRYLQQLVVLTAPNELLEQAQAAGQACGARPRDPEAFLNYAAVMERLLAQASTPDPTWNDTAARALERALTLGVKDEFSVRMRAAKARANLSDPDCVGHYRAAAALRPEDEEANVGLVESLRRSGEVQESVRVAQEARQRCPASPGLLYHLALGLERTGDAAGAREAYAESERLNPDDFRVQNDFGVLLFDRGEYQEALAHVRHGLALEPGDALAQSNLDRILARLDELSTATAHGREASTSLLFCPTCSVPMDALLVREVELDRCSACGGLWFDGGELKEVLEHMDSPGEVLDPPAVSPELARKPPGQRVCCRCKCTLRVGLFQGVEVDACPLCEGFFLDQGELAQLWGAMRPE